VRKPKIVQKTAEVEAEIETEIEFVCPVRGLVKQKVRGLKYKPLNVSTPKFTAEEISEIAEKIVDEDN
jgi:hypothetical protein